MKIDYSAIQRKAKAANISEIQIMKRESGYRKQKEAERLAGKHCPTCKLCTPVKYENTPEKIQCYWLGVKNDPHADIEAGHICKHYKRAYKGD